MSVSAFMLLKEATPAFIRAIMSKMVLSYYPEKDAKAALINNMTTKGF